MGNRFTKRGEFSKLSSYKKQKSDQNLRFNRFLLRVPRKGLEPSRE